MKPWLLLETLKYYKTYTKLYSNGLQFSSITILTSGCILMVITNSLSVGVSPGILGVGGSLPDTSNALAKAIASSFSISSLQRHDSPFLSLSDQMKKISQIERFEFVFRFLKSLIT